MTDGAPVTTASSKASLPNAHLHSAERLDHLVQALGDVVEQPLASPFAPDVIVVPARGREPWLAMELSRRFGVWANPRFPSPAAWGNELAETVLGVKADSPYERDGTLGYAIAALLPAQLGRPTFAPIAAYLEGDHDGSKRMTLARRIATTFRSYLLHRPEWIRAAERGQGAKDWQDELWKLLVERLGGDHPVRRMDALLAKLASGDHAPLPERVCVFGTRGLARIQLDLLAAVAARTEVHLFELATPLAPPLRASLSVHACHGPMRECEVLRDQILAILSEEPELEAHDIRVLCPDLPGYAPLIHAVFDLPHDDARRIPYRLDGEGSGSSLPVAGALLALLELLPTRMAASQVMDVLSLEPVRSRFGLNAGDLDRIQTWLAESGIRWGEDEGHRREEGQPALRHNTWAFGLDRLLLGFAMAPHDRQLFAGTLPFEDVEGSSARALGGFADFCEELFAARRAVQTPTDVVGWQSRLTTIVAELIGSSFETEYQHRIVLEELANEVESAKATAFSEPMTLATIATHLAARLEGRGRAGGFSCGGVSFVPFTPGRVVPSPVVVLLGMNLGTFPRIARPVGFDLLAKDPHPCDPSPRDEDRQTFLDALAAADRRLVITYDGHSVKNNAERPPSVVVSELLDALGGGEDRVVHHPLHPFDARYFGADTDPRLFSHSASLRDGAQASLGARASLPFPFGVPLPPDEARAVSLDELAKFFTNPIEVLCRTRLGLAFRKDAEPREDREPLDFDPLDKWKLGSALLERALRGEHFDRLPADVRAEGSLPLGVVAEPVWEEVRRNAVNLASAIAPHLSACARTPLSIDLQIAGMRLHGSLPHVGSRGHLVYRYGKLRGDHKIAAWVRHLVFLTAGGKAAHDTHLFGRADNAEVEAYRFTKVSHPERHLEKLLELHALGMRAPLPAFADPAFAYLEAAGGKKTAREAALENFHSLYGLHSTTAGNGNAYVKYVWGEHAELDPPLAFADLPLPSFEALVEDVYRPAFSHMKEVG